LTLLKQIVEAVLDLGRVLVPAASLITTEALFILLAAAVGDIVLLGLAANHGTHRHRLERLPGLAVPLMVLLFSFP
jgi:hypothetical protein